MVADEILSLIRLKWGFRDSSTMINVPENVLLKTFDSAEIYHIAPILSAMFDFDDFGYESIFVQELLCYFILTSLKV